MMSEEDERHLIEQVQTEFTAAGYSPGHIKSILQRQQVLKEKQDRLTYIKVSHQYLLPETVDAFGLPWEWTKVCFLLPNS